jgi:RNA polymerase sigma-70 factor, ECF subfamily
VDLRSLAPEELVAVCCATREESVWAEFIHRFQPLISTVALRTARQWGEPIPGLLDDLVQETYLKLCLDDCRLLKEFRSQYPHAIFGFLKIVTANVVHDHFKACRAVKRGSGYLTQNLGDHESCQTGSADQFDGSSPSAVEQSILIEQIDRCLVRGVPAQELARSRRIFWLYYRTGLTAKAIAALPNIGLSTKGIESTIFRLNRMVRRYFAAPPEAKESANVHAGFESKGINPAGSL